MLQQLSEKESQTQQCQENKSQAQTMEILDFARFRSCQPILSGGVYIWVAIRFIHTHTHTQYLTLLISLFSMLYTYM
jgi:hypothetical protein